MSRENPFESDLHSRVLATGALCHEMAWENTSSLLSVRRFLVRRADNGVDFGTRRVGGDSQWWLPRIFLPTGYVDRYMAVGEMRPDCDPSRSPGTYSRTGSASKHPWRELIARSGY